MNLLLTSDFPLTGNETILECIRNKGINPRIAWIPPFSKEGHERFPHAKEYFGSFGFTNLDYFDIDEESDKRQLNNLDQYDVIYLTGGNPVGFRHNILKSGLDSHLYQCLDGEILLIGASGGSMQFTKNISLFRLVSEAVDQVLTDHSEYRALNFIEYEFLPHLNKMEPSFLQKVKEYSKGINHDIISIADGSALFHTNGKVEYIGEAVRFRNGVMIPDIEA